MAKMMTEEQVLAKISESEESLLAYRKKAQTDFLWFITYVLGYRDVGKLKIFRDEIIPLLHKSLGDFPYSQVPQQKQFWELPRNTFKTTVFSVSLALWLICRDPNIRIGVCSWDKDTARVILKEIMEHGEENRVLRLLFRYIFPDSPRDKNGAKVWRANAMQVLRTASHKEATIEAFSISRQRTGRHYDIVLSDDIVDESNVVSDSSIQLVKDRFRLMFSILEIRCPMLVTGTRYSFYDLYGDLEGDAGIGEDFMVYKRGAYNENRELNFPERLDEEFLKQQRKTQGEYIFSCQYMLTPVNPEDAQIDISNMKTYKTLPKGHNFVYRGAIDTSFSGTSGSDPSVGVLFAVDTSTGHKWLVKAFRKRLRSAALISEIMAFGEYGASKGQTSIDIEAVSAAKEVLDEPLRSRMTATGNRFTYTLRSGYARRYQGGSKNEKPRIPILFSQHINTTLFPESLICRDEKGETFDFMSIVKKEAAEYPFSKYDDCVDAIAMAFIGMPSLVTIQNRQNSHVRQDKFGMWDKRAMNPNQRRYVATEA